MRGKNVNPSRGIIVHAAPHGITWLHVLLVLPGYYQANAQAVTAPPETSYDLYSNFNPAMAIIVVVLLGFFFAVGFLSIFIRHCSEASGAAQSSVSGERSRRGGLDPALIEAFPIFVYSAVKALKMGRGGLECAVCLSEFDDDETLRLLPKCNHVFHPDCIDAWLASHVTCPVCRAKVTADSGELVKDTLQQTTESNTESNQENSRPELGELQDHVVIAISEDQRRDSEVLEIANTSEATFKENRLPRSGILGKFPRSHSTGHSLVQFGGNIESYTLRLPDEVRKQIVTNGKLKRTASYDVILARAGSSRKGYRSSGECSSKGKNYVDRTIGRSERGGGRSDRWVFSMTPPFISKMGSVKSPKLGDDGDVSNAKTLLTSVKVPLNSLNVKVELPEESSARPPV